MCASRRVDDSHPPACAGDVSVQRSAALLVEGSVNFTLDGARFDRVGGNALMLANFTRGARVTGNEFVWTGDNAIVQIGSAGALSRRECAHSRAATDDIDGTSGEQPRGTLIERNLIHELGCGHSRAA